MLGRKGQEGAPFELLIAVIVMSFVIVVGLNAMSILMKAQCEGRIDSQMEEMKRSIESVTAGNTKASASFELPGCFSEKESKLKIVDMDDKAICSHYCGSGEQCTLLTFSTPSYSNWKCLRISTSTVFPAEKAGSPCDSSKLAHASAKYCVDEWKSEPIREGSYTLIRDTSLYTDNPVVCVYRLKEGREC